MQKQKASVSSKKEEKAPLLKYLINPHRKPDKERATGKLMTIPDQGLTIKQILERHTRGLRTPDVIAGVYDEHDPLELDGVNFDTLDLSEQHDHMRKLREKNLDIKKRYKQHLDSIAEYRKRKQWEAEYTAKNPGQPLPNTKEVSTAAPSASI